MTSERTLHQQLTVAYNTSGLLFSSVGGLDCDRCDEYLEIDQRLVRLYLQCLLHHRKDAVRILDECREAWHVYRETNGGAVQYGGHAAPSWHELAVEVAADRLFLAGLTADAERLCQDGKRFTNWGDAEIEILVNAWPTIIAERRKYREAGQIQEFSADFAKASLELEFDGVLRMIDMPAHQRNLGAVAVTENPPPAAEPEGPDDPIEDALRDQALTLYQRLAKSKHHVCYDSLADLDCWRAFPPEPRTVLRGLRKLQSDLNEIGGSVTLEIDNEHRRAKLCR